MATQNSNTLPDWHDSEAISRMGNDEFSDFVFDKLESEEPILTMEYVEKLETAFGELGRNRRVALAVLTKKWSEIRDLVVGDDGDAHSFAVMAECMDSRPYHDVASLIDAAEMRVKAALCHRADMQDLLAAAEEEVKLWEEQS